MSGTEEPEVEPTAEDKKEAQLLKEEAEKQKLKDEEEYKKKTSVERTKYFKGTIVVVVIYGVIILGISIAGMLSPTMKELLFVSGFPFTVTFISGVILIIIALLVQLFTYKPAPMPEKYSGDNMSCPDYWVLKKTPKEELAKMNSKVRKLSKYYCQNPEESIDIDLPGTITNANANSGRKLIALKNVSNRYNDSALTIAGDYHMRCNRLYPDYMAAVDKRTFPLNPTSMRCEYVQQCGIGNTANENPTQIAWTNVCNK
jgi:hypothetical protein